MNRNRHANAKPDLLFLYKLLEDAFPEEEFQLYRTGNDKQTISISHTWNRTEDIVNFLKSKKAELAFEGIYERLWKINNLYFMDYK